MRTPALATTLVLTSLLALGCGFGGSDDDWNEEFDAAVEKIEKAETPATIEEGTEAAVEEAATEAPAAVDEGTGEGAAEKDPGTEKPAAPVKKVSRPTGGGVSRSTGTAPAGTPATSKGGVTKPATRPTTSNGRPSSGGISR